MKCASCDQSISIIQLLVGHKCCRSQDQERELEQSTLLRLLTTIPDEPKPLSIPRTQKTSTAPQSEVIAIYPTTESQTTPITTELPELSQLKSEPDIRAGGHSWRCRCPHCLAADKVPLKLACPKK